MVCIAHPSLYLEDMILFFTIEGETNTFHTIIMIILRKNDFDSKKESEICGSI